MFDRVLSHPQERIQRSVLHELGDDSLWRAAGDYPLQLQDIGVVKLAQDPGLAEEHALLPVRRPPAEGLHSNQHLSPAQRAITTARHLPELSWRRTEGES